MKGTPFIAVMLFAALNAWAGIDEDVARIRQEWERIKYQTPAKAMRILLVEDDELLGSGLSDALERANYAHAWVRDAGSALSAAISTTFDLIILDLGLPDRDGIEVLKQLRERADQTPCTHSKRARYRA